MVACNDVTSEATLKLDVAGLSLSDVGHMCNGCCQGGQLQDLVEKSCFKNGKYVVLPHIVAGLGEVGLCSHDQAWLLDVPCALTVCCNVGDCGMRPSGF